MSFEKPIRQKSWRVRRLSLVIALLVGLAACKFFNHSAALGNSVRTYTIRGQVVSVPQPHNPASELMIQHESIPGFEDDSGKVVGMESMTMSFIPAKGLSLAAIKPGDKIEFVLSVDWPDDRIQIISITVLPADTKLNF